MFEIENIADAAAYVAPKCYSLLGIPSGNNNYVLKAKGLNQNARLTLDFWDIHALLYKDVSYSLHQTKFFPSLLDGGVSVFDMENTIKNSNTKMEQLFKEVDIVLEDGTVETKLFAYKTKPLHLD